MEKKTKLLAFVALGVWIAFASFSFGQDRNTGDKDHYYRVPVQKDDAGNIVGGGFSYRLPHETWELKPDEEGREKYLVAYGPWPAIKGCTNNVGSPNSYRPHITVNDFRAGGSLMAAANNVVSSIASGKMKIALEQEYKDMQIQKVQLIEPPKPGRTERDSVELVTSYDFLLDGRHYIVTAFTFYFQAKHEPNTKFRLSLLEHVRADCNSSEEIVGDRDIEGPANSFDMTR